MPRIWADTIDAHRRQVTDAILDATAQLIVEQGPMSVGMAVIAKRAGIGRATLYKYFPDLESILVAWHTRDFAGHLQHLDSLTERENVTRQDVADFVRTQRHHHAPGDSDELIGPLAHSVAGFVHQLDNVVHQEVFAALITLVERMAEDGEVRSDLEPHVLAQWLFHAIHAPPDLDESAVAQLTADSLAPRPTSTRTRS